MVRFTRRIFRVSMVVIVQASLLAGQVEDAEVFGWTLRSTGTPTEGEGGGATHDWAKMVQGVQNYIKGLNFKYRADLRSKGVSSRPEFYKEIVSLPRTWQGVACPRLAQRIASLTKAGAS